MLPKAWSRLLLPLAAVAAVLIPFLFWHQSWFGRPLTNQQLSEYLHKDGKPRQIQHALVQIAERMERGENAAQWYPRLMELANHRQVELRSTVAWVMGQATERPQVLQQVLRRMLQDPEDLVRANAALALVRYDDANARTELLRLLESSQPERVWEALRGLYIVGLKSDAPKIEKVSRDAQWSQEIRQQARLTLEAIKKKRTHGSQFPR
ncbi:MAG: HEAT repeat domain-containing protein [Acidobacteria bacterium]|nr:HEAT repeat domain-containing protein [Acidobacteriota bacterium]